MLALIPVLLVGVVSYSILQNALFDSAKANANDIVSIKMSNFDLISSNMEQTLGELAVAGTTQDFLQIRGDNQSDEYYRNLLLVSSKMESLIHQYGGSIRTAAFLWNNGEVPLVRGDSLGLNLYGDYRENSLFREFDQSSVAIRWLHMTDELGNPQVFIYKALFSPDGMSVGVAVFLLYNYFIFNLFSESAEPESFFLLLDSKSRMITATPIESSYIQELLALVDEDASGIINREYAFGEKKNSYFITSATSRVNSWRFILCSPLDDIRNSSRAVTLVVMIVIICAAAGAVSAGIFLYRYINYPIWNLSAAMEKFRKGDFSVRIKNGRTDELGLLITGFNEMAEQTLMLIDNIKQEQEKRHETEIHFLQAQIYPHFLYNTLNATKVLVRQGRKKDAADMITALISLLRLTSNGDEYITLDQELAYIQNYISIMEFRKDQKISLFIQVEEDAAACMIPKFTLQPLVENSIIHGFSHDKSCNYEIYIEAKVKDLVLNIQLADNGSGFSASDEPAGNGNERFTKVGIQNVNERIQMYYGSEYGLVVKSEPGSGTVVMLYFPAEYSNVRQMDDDVSS